MEYVQQNRVPPHSYKTYTLVKSVILSVQCESVAMLRVRCLPKYGLPKEFCTTLCFAKTLGLSKFVFQILPSLEMRGFSVLF